MSGSLTTLTDEAVALAAAWLRTADELKTRQDEAQAALMAQMLADPDSLAFTLELADQVFRPSRPERAAALLDSLIERRGLPSYLSKIEQTAFSVGVAASRYAARVAVPAIRHQVRSRSADLILDADDAALTRYLAGRQDEGFDVNVNLLGEAVLGDREAESRMLRNLMLIDRPDVSHVSVKISSIVGRLRPAAFDDSVVMIARQLRRLYRAADRHIPPTFVNLDMEAYEDLELTVAAFQKVLDEPEFSATRAGLALQAYLPDSHEAQRQLTGWARRRVERGGAPVRVRLVKGANLGLEHVTAELNGWTPAPYATKQETDASYKRMVLYAVEPAHAEAVRIGIGSHNLFDVAFAYLAAQGAGSLDQIEFEMLQGMASHQARAILAETGRLLLYAPIVDDDDFVSAVAYLARRLEENTQPENYLRHVVSIGPSGDVFEREAARFRAAVAAWDSVREGRGREKAPGSVRTNAANSDFTNPATRAELAHALARERSRTGLELPLVVGGSPRHSPEIEIGRDPSDPGAESYRFAVATHEDVGAAVDSARRAQRSWAARPIADRAAILREAARRLEVARYQLIACMVRDGGKQVVQGDTEVSEAVDMANYYAEGFSALNVDDCRFEPFGVVALAPPWNFPLAIPAGGALASLMAGNAVIMKPAPEAVLVAWELCSILWEAGIPEEALQFLPCRDDETGRSLIESADGVILTGSWMTGKLFTSWRPELRLFAETSGKNAFVISATADLDEAIADLVDSAFGHSGQKCSAASLALVEGEVYDAPAFRRQLADAVESLTVGPAWDPVNDVTNLIGSPSPELMRGLTVLEAGEEWLVEPQLHTSGAWSPGVRLGVRPGSFFHTTECFGPVLGVVRVGTVGEAVAIANRSEFGLTGGLHSLDEAEIAEWADHIEVGNAYVNRTTTGAVVGRQPFGGWKQSVFGPGAKAGGPNYVAQLGTWHQLHDPPTGHSEAPDLPDPGVNLGAVARDRWTRAVQSQRQAWEAHFSVEHDPSALRSESNIFRYRPLPDLVVRVVEPDPLAIAVACSAAETAGVQAEVSMAPDLVISAANAIVEDDSRFAERLRQMPFGRVRHIGDPSPAVRRAARDAHVHLADDPVVLNGRLELRHYLREQSVSRKLHRHGMIPGSEQPWE